MTEAAAPPVNERWAPHERRLRDRFGDAVQDLTPAGDIPTFTVDAAQIVPVSQFVKDELGFKLPALLSGVDLVDHLEVVYHLWHMESQEVLGLRVKLPPDNPRVQTVTTVWRGMDWHEREAFDLFGILFDGHPDLRRILLPDDWEGYPLLKSYTAID